MNISHCLVDFHCTRRPSCNSPVRRSPALGVMDREECLTRAVKGKSYRFDWQLTTQAVVPKPGRPDYGRDCY